MLGIYQSSTENSAACLALLNELEKRGLPECNLLFVVDGGSSINKALNEKYEVENAERRRAIRIRCHIHKWNNIRDAKGQAEAAPLFWAMRDARDMGVAKACSDSLETVLKKHNQSALASYHEAKDPLVARTVLLLKLLNQLPSSEIASWSADGNVTTPKSGPANGVHIGDKPRRPQDKNGEGAKSDNSCA